MKNFWSQKYVIHDKANIAYAKRLSQGNVRATLVGLVKEYVFQTLIAIEQMKNNGDYIVEREFGDAITLSLSEKNDKILENWNIDPMEAVGSGGTIQRVDEIHGVKP